MQKPQKCQLHRQIDHKKTPKPFGKGIFGVLKEKFKKSVDPSQTSRYISKALERGAVNTDLNWRGT
ncbi:MAG: hypothetical protein AAFN42_04565 [Cyanobacteria bacterium J06554_1]